MHIHARATYTHTHEHMRAHLGENCNHKNHKSRYLGAFDVVNSVKVMIIVFRSQIAGKFPIASLFKQRLDC